MRIIQLGSQVRVHPDYFNQLGSKDWRRYEYGIVVSYQINSSHDEPFIDHYIQFECGKIEPYGEWELDDITSALKEQDHE